MIEYQEHIVAIPASIVTERTDGIVRLPSKLSDHIVLKRRASLLNDFNYRKLMPLTIFVCHGKVAAFMRRDDHQHEALRGKITLGVGGHFELRDLQHNNSIIDIEAAILKASSREIEEEVVIGDDVEIIKSETLEYAIAADETITDRQYVALVTVVHLDQEDLMPNPVEDELYWYGWFKPDELLVIGADKNETWTKKICTILDKLEI